jgi:hypothetical protein
MRVTHFYMYSRRTRHGKERNTRRNASDLFTRDSNPRPMCSDGSNFVVTRYTSDPVSKEACVKKHIFGSDNLYDNELIDLLKVPDIEAFSEALRREGVRNTSSQLPANPSICSPRNESVCMAGRLHLRRRPYDFSNNVTAWLESNYSP